MTSWGSCGDEKCKPDILKANDKDWYTIKPTYNQRTFSSKTYGEEFMSEYEKVKNMDCDQLESEFNWAYAIFESHDFVKPGSHYYDLHPFDDKIWA